MNHSTKIARIAYTLPMSARNQRKKAQRIRKKAERDANQQHDDEVLKVQDALSMLSEETRLALQEHLRDKDNDKAQSANEEGVQEDFHLSQFWYDDQSAALLGHEALERADQVRGQGKGMGRIACISCPSIYRAIVKIMEDMPQDEQKNDVVLFEFDERLSRLVPAAQAQRNFVLYDFREENLARMIPAEFEGYFDFVVVDPPYLNKDCMLAFQKAIEFVSRRDESSRLFCTGAVLEPVFAEALPEYKMCSFQPTHSCKLGNAFATYANYESKRLNE
jgi:hypothetical protein